MGKELKITTWAWANIQNKRASGTGKKMVIGVLLWDLSAAFDTLDPILLCKKLALSQFENHTVN